MGESLKRAETGQQVLWIENTVAEAQEIFCLLSSRAQQYGIETGLIHSRFLVADRQKKEDYWVNLYGKDGEKDRYLRGRILVGTQVLEQSLDIDADYLVTRLAPTDMLLQRIGRLWRHLKIDVLRPSTARREVWILAPTIEEAEVNYQTALGKSQFVYAPFVLIRTLELWNDLSEIELPGQIRFLIEETYRDRQENGLMAKLCHQLNQEKEKLQRLALVGVSTGEKTLPETKANTRYSDRETCEVLILNEVTHNEKGTTVSFIDGKELFLASGLRFKNKRKWREVSSELMRNILKVPIHHAPEKISRSNLTWLKDYVYLGNEEETPFRIAIIQKSGTLLGLNQTNASRKYNLEYNSILGYKVEKKNNSPINEEW